MDTSNIQAETSAALAEYEAMKNHPENYKRYDFFEELLYEVLEKD